MSSIANLWFRIYFWVPRVWISYSSLDFQEESSRAGIFLYYPKAQQHLYYLGAVTSLCVIHSSWSAGGRSPSPALGLQRPGHHPATPRDRSWTCQCFNSFFDLSPHTLQFTHLMCAILWHVVFSQSCTNTPQSILGHFITPKGNPGSLSTGPQCSSFSQHLTNTSLYSVSVDFPALDILCKGSPIVNGL